MKKLIAAVVCAAALCGSATQYSCLSIITAAKQAGKWDALKAWISAAGLKDEWDKCAYLSDAYPQYPAITNALVAAGIVTDAEIKTILANSVDTAIPDTSLRRVYEMDMSNATGRVKWHGKVVSTVVDTNALTRTRVHEDGFVFVEPFKAVQPRTVVSRLTDAQRKAKAAEDERKRNEARLEYLLAHEAEEIARLEKQYPPMLAALLYTNSVNNAKSAVSKYHQVTATITAP